MAVTATVLIPAKIAEAVQTPQYVASNVTAIIDKFTATNFSAAAATISVHLITAGSSADDSNVITKTKRLQPTEVYTFPEIVGQILTTNSSISTVAGTANAVNIRASGREVT